MIGQWPTAEKTLTFSGTGGAPCAVAHGRERWAGAGEALHTLVREDAGETHHCELPCCISRQNGPVRCESTCGSARWKSTNSLVSNTPKLSPCATRACGGSCRRRPTLGPHTCCPCPVRLWVCLCQAHAAHLRDPCRTPSESRVAPVNFGEVDHTARGLRQKIGPRTGRPPALVTQTDSLPAEAGWWLATRQKSAALSPTAGEQRLPSCLQTTGFFRGDCGKTKHRFVGMCVMKFHFTAHYCPKFEYMVKKRTSVKGDL